MRFRGSLDRFRSKKLLRCSHFSRNSLRKLTGKIFQGTGNFLQVSGNSGSRITSGFNQRKYCEACGIPLNAFGNWQAKFKAEPQPPVRKVLYRRGSISHALSHGLNHDLRGSGPIVPPARAVVVGGSAKQTNGRYFGGDAAGLVFLRGSWAPWDRGTCSAPVEAGDNARGCTFVRHRRDHFRILRLRKVRIR